MKWKNSTKKQPQTVGLTMHHRKQQQEFRDVSVSPPLSPYACNSFCFFGLCVNDASHGTRWFDWSATTAVKEQELFGNVCVSGVGEQVCRIETTSCSTTDKNRIDSKIWPNSNSVTAANFLVCPLLCTGTNCFASNSTNSRNIRLSQVHQRIRLRLCSCLAQLRIKLMYAWLRERPILDRIDAVHTVFGFAGSNTDSDSLPLPSNVEAAHSADFVHVACNQRHLKHSQRCRKLLRILPQKYKVQGRAMQTHRDTATLLSLPDALIRYLGQLLSYDDFYFCFIRVNQRCRDVCFKNSEYARGMARTQCDNIVKELVRAKLRIDGVSRRHLKRLFNGGECEAKYLRYHVIVEAEDEFFWEFEDAAQVWSELELVYEKISHVAGHVVKRFNDLLKNSPHAKDVLEPLIRRFEVLVRGKSVHFVVLSLIDILLHLREKENVKCDYCLLIVLQVLNANYEFLSLWRWLFLKFDERFDMMFEARRDCNFEGDAENWKQVCLGRFFYNSTPLALMSDNRRFVQVPTRFARDIVYFTLFGSKNCQEVSVNIRLKKFNGLSALGIECDKPINSSRGGIAIQYRSEM